MARPAGTALASLPHPYAPTAAMQYEYCDYLNYSATGILFFGAGVQLGRMLVGMAKGMTPSK